MADPAETGRERMRRVAGMPLLLCVLTIALPLGGCNPSEFFDALTGGSDAYCTGLDTSNLDPLNPAHRDCFCDLYGSHPVCRPDIIVGY